MKDDSKFATVILSITITILVAVGIMAYFVHEKFVIDEIVPVEISD